jgi:hypothetical protein
MDSTRQIFLGYHEEQACHFLDFKKMNREIWNKCISILGDHFFLKIETRTTRIETLVGEIKKQAYILLATVTEGEVDHVQVVFVSSNNTVQIIYAATPLEQLRKGNLKLFLYTSFLCWKANDIFDLFVHASDEYAHIWQKFHFKKIDKTSIGIEFMETEDATNILHYSLGKDTSLLLSHKFGLFKHYIKNNNEIILKYNTPFHTDESKKMNKQMSDKLADNYCEGRPLVIQICDSCKLSGPTNLMNKHRKKTCKKVCKERDKNRT